MFLPKLLVICGPTAVGKTTLAFELARKFNGELVSADSRQVFCGLDIATGKETSSKVKTWLVDICGPQERFSVAQYKRLAEKVIGNLHRHGKLPILVGGTGFYIKAVVDGIETIGIAPNQALRQAYSKKTTDELFEILFHLNPDLASRLNPSERKNKQRLIRKIEIEQSGLDKIKNKKKYDVLFIGLVAPREILKEKIMRRVDEWIRQGAEAEVKKLLESGVTWQDQSMSALGYRQWKPYFEQEATREEVIKNWKKDEWQYAKRQLTYFKKDSRIHWFDVTKPGWQTKVEKIVKKWYDKNDAEND